MATRTAGFTLIELLVVISIIGLLSSVVLASLNSARTKAKDTTIKGEMAQMRIQAMLFFTTYGTYLGTGYGGSEDTVTECLVDTNPSFISRFAGSVYDPTSSINVHTLATSVSSNRNTAPGTRIFCGADATRFAFAVPLHNSSSGFNGWCVDSTGATKEVQLDFASQNNAFLACP